MGNLSKFLKATSALDCSAYHPGISCTRNITNCAWNNLVSSLKFLAPTVLIYLIRRSKTLNKTTIQDALKLYMKLCIIAALSGTIGIVINCSLEQILPRRLFWIKAPISAYASLYLMVFETVQTFRKTFADLLYQASLELILTDENRIGRLIVQSKFVQTILFTISNILILHGRRYYNTKNLWLVTPYSEITESNRRRCYFHKNQNCDAHILYSIRNYFLLGVFFDAIDAIRNLYGGHLHGVPLRATKFFSLFGLLYKLTHCLLNRYFINNDIRNHLIASALSGVSFLRYPNITLLNYNIVQAVQTILYIIERQCITKLKGDSQVLDMLLNFPYAKIICPAMGTIAYLVYIITPEYSSALIGRLVNGVTGNYVRDSRRIFQERLRMGQRS